MYFSSKFSGFLLEITNNKFSEKLKGKCPLLFPKIRNLSKEIQKRLEAHTAFFHITAEPSVVRFQVCSQNRWQHCPNVHVLVLVGGAINAPPSLIIPLYVQFHVPICHPGCAQTPKSRGFHSVHHVCSCFFGSRSCCLASGITRIKKNSGQLKRKFFGRKLSLNQVTT